MKIEKILVVQIRPYGDVLLATSYLEALRQKFPSAIIDYFVSEPYHEILYKNPFINNVLVSAKKKGLRYYVSRLSLLIKVFRTKYDLIIDQQGNAGSRTILMVSRAKYRLGSAICKSAFLYNLKSSCVKDRYAAFCNFDMLIPLGISEQPFKFHYYIHESSQQKIDKWLQDNNIDTEKLIVFSPGAGEVYKQWNTDYFAQVANTLLQHYNFHIAVVWAPNEYNAAKRMHQLTDAKTFFAPDTSINEAVALLKRAKLLVCNDGGLNHLSVATDTPSFAVFGNTNPTHWSAQGCIKHHYHIYNEGNGNLPGNTFGISPDDVFQKLQSVLVELSLDTYRK